VKLSVLVPEEAMATLEGILFRETGTLGVRRYAVQRSKMQREAVTVETPWGPVKAKRGWREDGVRVLAPEYEDCVRVARENKVALREVYAVIQRKEM
jgi:pyridinium-3,5-bisthiocarboxylic acid mononucleotide nickel chelatase